MAEADELEREITALTAFLAADPEQWPSLAPAVVDAVGLETMREIVGQTRDRLGGIDGVVDSAEGLLVVGPRAQVFAWVATDPDGVITGMWLSGGGPRGRGWLRRFGPGLRWSGFAVFVGYSIAGCWRAGTITGWLGAASLIGLGLLTFEVLLGPAEHPRWIRRAVEAAFGAALVSVVRLPGLPVGRSWVFAGLALGVPAGSAVVLIRDRRHRWGVSTVAPLRFPLNGAWYVGNGGGKILNHHHTLVPDQRGALDLVQIGPGGTREGPAGDVEAYYAYRAVVRAPCDGRVISAGDGMADQVPGVVRFVGAPYGNHVFIDTGTEVVRLAHLRLGTVAVRTGDEVRAGDVLGEVGNSGNSTEPHLHLDACRDGLGLDLIFEGISGTLYRGRTVGSRPG